MNSSVLRKIYALYCKYPSICTDTRKISSPSIFWCIKGENFDGNKFAEIALSKGAVAAVVDKFPENITPSNKKKIIVVEDALKALQELATHHRKQIAIPVIGITGTNGKTTTKELTKNVLACSYHVYATKGNLNNHIGVPLSILEINRDHEIAIIEMGANHIGEIADLCLISQPTHGIITNIGDAHIEGFGTFDGVVRAKNELYQYIKKNDGLIFINKDDHLLQELGYGIKQYSYGKNKNAHVVGKLLNGNIFLRLICYQSKMAKKVEISTQLTGNYNFYNCLVSICVGRYFKVPDKDIFGAITKYLPDNNRSQIKKTTQNTLIMDAYNANPSSMTQAINNIAQISHPKKVLILGDMMELGENSHDYHQEIINQVNSYLWYSVMVIGEYFNQTLMPAKFKKFKTTVELIKHIEQEKINDCLVLIKGSRKMALEETANFL